MLPCKGNPDNGNGQDDPEYNVCDSNPDSAAEDPDNVQQHSKAAATGGGANGHAAERPENKAGQLKTLQAERNANDGAA